jgi:methionyl-tRNA formyltransferase
VYTRAPRPAGRGLEERKSPVHAYAAAANLPVRTPRSLRDEAAQEAFAGHAADAGVVVAYGLILPKAVLDAPRHGCLNLHASTLPRWRGAAPINRAVMAGDAATAATIMRMDEGLDTGPVCLAEPVPIGPDITAGELHDVLMQRGADLMVRALAEMGRGTLTCAPQPEVGVTYAAKIDKAETAIDFARPAAEVHNHVRGLSPFPGAWFAVGGKRERIKVLRTRTAPGSGAPGTVLDDALTAACGEGAVQLLELQRAGKRPMAAAELLRGFPLPPRTQLA